LPTQLQKHIKDLRANLRQQIADLEATAPTFSFAYALVANKSLLPDEMDARVSTWLVWGNRVKINVTVKSFRDMLPILERIESLADHGVLGYSFTNTEDHPSYSERQYISSKLLIEARLKGEGDDSCRRVVTGYTIPKPQPIYGFDCGDGEEQLPTHENPDEMASAPEANAV
jgi:hypothetical protein